MHRRSKRNIQAKNDGNWGKTVVLGLLQRDGNVKAAVAPNRRKRQVQDNIQKNVAPGSKLYTDEFTSYDNLPDEYTREFVNHLSTYVNGKVHTNGIENFWSLLKRTLKGTYVSVDPAHLQAYVDEQAFRFNMRQDREGMKLKDSERFHTAVCRIVGKRLMWEALVNTDGGLRP